MLTLLSEAGRSFLRAFVGSIVILAPGVLAAPDLNRAVALGIAAVIASIAAGLKAVQIFVPQLSFKSITALGPWYVYLDSFVRAFVATLITSLIGILNMPTLSFSTALLVSLLVAAVTAGVRAVQGFLSKGDVPSPTKGLDEPPAQVTT